ncbi:MAG TPA: bifunctional serine/threonine-protein kinase/formylglycine-generating enzyme family protein [Candidatus Hydrogenedens sp.]|nr:SUMF1/EgtB/PvdO family nonheme iron enzyme [Candidatus Hydrogenedens sp.]HOL18851.1 bifunctional serine/threonine-protein kinase/formylglycine-generating enzyme family protein [Candidatus Hydrogenedens sp.]
MQPIVSVICKNCGLKIWVPAVVQGRKSYCFNCHQPIVVPNLTGDTSFHIEFKQGDRIDDRYIIEGLIGKGGMGYVYRAKDELLDEAVALKFLHPSLLKAPKAAQLFIKEAQLARRLRHENIIAVHDVDWTNEGFLFLSMEYLEGQSLRSLLRKYRIEKKYIPVRIGIQFTLQILQALEYAHRWVTHRDLKPENVMVLPGEKIKVLDFGLALAVEESISQSASSETKLQKSIVGTYAYASPEQKKRWAIDTRADLYSVGLILYELLTLRSPIDEYVPLLQLRSDVSPSINDVLQRALKEEREDRWQTALEFREALQESFEKSYTEKKIHVITKIQKEKNVSTEKMVFLEGGYFLMGNDEVVEESPEEEVFVEPFWMDIYPVTVAEYQKYIEATGAPLPRYWHDPVLNGPDQPIVGISWFEANEYAQWAGKMLPSEKEWEFAARGKENRKYPWGNTPPDTIHCNYNNYLGIPSIVTMHEEGRTPDGICDLAGNVMEWTRDYYLPYSVARSQPDKIPNPPLRVVRGGCWSSSSNEITCTARKGLFPETRTNTVGFRCILPLKK